MKQIVLAISPEGQISKVHIDAGTTDAEKVAMLTALTYVVAKDLKMPKERILALLSESFNIIESKISSKGGAE